MRQNNTVISTHDPGRTSLRRWSGAFGLIALVTCPCHLPLLAFALSGTAAGALIAAHFDAALMLFTVAFLLSICAAIWVLWSKRIHGS
jgi:mercuric ion transport protein